MNADELDAIKQRAEKAAAWLDSHATAHSGRKGDVRAYVQHIPALVEEVRWLREERNTAFEDAVTAVRVYTPVLVDGGTVYVPRAAVIADIRAVKDQRPYWLGDAS